MWGVLQQGISTLDVDFRAYAGEHFDRLLANAATPRFERALSTSGVRAATPDCTRDADPTLRAVQPASRPPSSRARLALAIAGGRHRGDGAGGVAGRGAAGLRRHDLARRCDGVADGRRSRRPARRRLRPLAPPHRRRRRRRARVASPGRRRRRPRREPDPVLIGAGDIARCDDERRRGDRAAGRRQRRDRVHARRQRLHSGSPREFRDCYDPIVGTGQGPDRVPRRRQPRLRDPERRRLPRLLRQARDPRRRRPGTRATSATGTSSCWTRTAASPAAAAARTPRRSAGCATTSRRATPGARSRCGTSRGSAAASTATTRTSRRSGTRCTTAGADLVLNGHDHDYERFAPQDPTGRADPDRGITEIVVGTGGGEMRDFGIAGRQLDRAAGAAPRA